MPATALMHMTSPYTTPQRFGRHKDHISAEKIAPVLSQFPVTLQALWMCRAEQLHLPISSALWEKLLELYFDGGESHLPQIRAASWAEWAISHARSVLWLKLHPAGMLSASCAGVA